MNIGDCGIWVDRKPGPIDCDSAGARWVARLRRFATACLLAGGFAGPASAAVWALTGALGAHDPSLFREGTQWWCFSTGMGISVKSSPDGLAWTAQASIFASELSWWRTYAPSMGTLDVWAPDVHAFGGRVWCYYCVSEFGTNNSAIGLTSCSSLAAGDWRDDGLVISSQSAVNAFNAIDPSLVIDAGSQPWLVFGSWFDGLHVVQLDPGTMKPTGTVYSIAQRSGGIEGANIVLANGYYYLFASIGQCCLGVNSTYKIAYGRSASVTGPYVDQSGTALASGGGTVLDAGDSRWIGPGGHSVIQNGSVWIIAYHAYDANNNGAPTLQIRDLYWDANYWPTYAGFGEVVSTPAGLGGVAGSVDGIGTTARFFAPADVATDPSGNVYVADTYNHTIRKLTRATGAVTTLAGLAGSPGSADAAGSAARFNHPSGLAADSAGNLYVADTDNDTIRKITAGGSVSTVAGLAGVSGSVDGSGSDARFNGPSGIAVDNSGDLCVADTLNHTIRRVTSAGVVSLIAGAAGASGSTDGVGSAARFQGPQGLAIDSSGDLFVADTNNNTLRRITLATGAVITMAGSAGVSGCLDGMGSQAQFFHPSGLAIDPAGNLYAADTDNSVVREINQSGSVVTAAGQPFTIGGADGVGGASRFDFPSGIAVDSSGSIYVADTNNNTIRLLVLPAAPGLTAQPQSQTVTAGANVQFSVTATGQPAPTYQWYFDGAVVSGATGSTLSLTNVQTANAGNYTVTVTNSTGNVTSTAATLTVNPANTGPSGGGGGGSGGGGGGGAPGMWFLAGLALLTGVRWTANKRRK